MDRRLEAHEHELAPTHGALGDVKPVPLALLPRSENGRHSAATLREAADLIGRKPQPATEPESVAAAPEPSPISAMLAPSSGLRSRRAPRLAPAFLCLALPRAHRDEGDGVPSAGARASAAASLE